MGGNRLKYPILYAKNETDFFSLGLGVMTNTLEASVTEERNGSFYFESKIIIDGVIYPQLENDQLIKVDAGHELKNQRFRIKKIVDNHNGTASIYAEHISYLSAELSLKPEVTVSGNGSTALTIWKSSLIGANSFVVDSDITTSNSTKWRIDKVQNPRQALGGVEGSILEKWGGEYRFDNYHISLLSKRGTTADVLLAYGRNITDFEQERNISNTFNSVYPFAIYTDDKQQERLITLSDYFVDSSNIASFPNRKAQTVDFSNEFEHDVVPTQDKLKSLAQKYIKSNGIGVPSVSIKVSFVDLSKTSDYENIAPLERLNLCDEVHVIYPKLKVNTTAKVVRIVWNVLAESYDEIEIGEKRVSLSDKISEQTKFIDEVKTSANAALVSANGKNTNFYGLFGEDGKGEPKATKVGDLWYKPNGDKSELYQWNGTVWSFIISNDWQEIFEEKLTEELAKSKKDLDAALAEKDKAIKDLDKKVADKLVVIDNSIVQAKSDTADAKKVANDAVAKANSNIIDLQAVKIDITKALNDSTSALNAVKVVDGRVDSVTTTIADIRLDMNGKADKTTVASQISQSATQVKVDLQSWTNGKLNDYSTIQATSNSIALATADKATKAQVTLLSDQITSTVTGLTDDSMITVDMIKDANTKHPDYPDMIVLGIPATSGETYIVSTNKPNRGTESAPIADVFYTQAWNAPPSSQSNGAWSGHSVTTKAVINRIYLVFRDANFLNSFANGEYWVKVISAPASQSQITQLVDDINIRVKDSEIVNQINLSKEGILIAGSKVQITGQTYIENGVITSAKIQDLSASKLIAGTIDASLINVTKINASNITTGTLSADRIAANSITATHISISSLSALSANLGIVTAGTINAATVNIININAASITTGTLNADRIGANSITADKIKATSLDLFSNDSYTNVRSDGMRIQSKAQIIFGPWIDINGNRRSTQGIYIGGFGGGTKHVALTRSNGTTFLLRAEDGMDYGANQNVKIGDLNLYDSVQFWESARVHGNLINEGYIAMGGGIQEASIQYEKSAGTMNFRVPGARSGSYFWFNQRAISEGSFDSKSKLSLKNVKGRYKGNALREIVNTDIVEYSYKNDPKRRQLSPIIDDINKIKKYKLPDIINDGESVNLYAMNSMSWLAIKQLAKKLETIEEKLDAFA